MLSQHRAAAFFKNVTGNTPSSLSLSLCSIVNESLDSRELTMMAAQLGKCGKLSCIALYACSRQWASSRGFRPPCKYRTKSLFKSHSGQFPRQLVDDTSARTQVRRHRASSSKKIASIPTIISAISTRLALCLRPRTLTKSWVSVKMPRRLRSRKFTSLLVLSYTAIFLFP